MYNGGGSPFVPLKNTGSNPVKLVPRDRATHYLSIVIVFIRIEAIFIFL